MTNNETFKAISKMTKKELLAEYTDLRYMIDDEGCFGMSDLKRLERIEKEIDKRELVIHETIKYSFD